MKHQSSRAALIAKRDFMSKDVDESDDEDSGGESYNIDAGAGHMYQSVTFDVGGRSARLKAELMAAADKKGGDFSPQRKHKHKSSKGNGGGSGSGRRAPHGDGGDPLDLLTSSGKNSPALAALDHKPLGYNKKDPLLKKNVKDNRTVLSSLDGPVPNLSEEEIALQRTVLFRQQEEEKLAQEKEEMRLMMEEIKREKMELQEMNKTKEQNKQAEKELALREREDLRIALEAMRNQNEMLQNQMIQTTEEAKLELEQERQERAQQVSEIEKKNRQLTQQVLDQQAEAERKLAAERDELRIALKRMEDDKLALSTKIYETEMASKLEAEEIEKQRLEFANSLKQMENEKFNLQKRVQDNEAKAQNASDALSSQLAKEKEDLEKKLSLMDSEKNQLSEALMAKEEVAQSHAKELAAKLEAEKIALQESTLRMEQEKVEMAAALAEAENEAKKQASIVAEQLKKEQEILKDTKNIMRYEQEALEEKLKRNQEEALKNNTEMTEEMKKERAILEAHLAAMRKEKEEMEATLKKTAEENIKREKEAAERMAKERDELREAVERMKAEMELEKKRTEQALAAKDSVKSKSGLNLTSASNKSLYNILEEGEDGKKSRPESGRKSHRSSRKNLAGASKRSLQRMVIKERDEDATEEAVKNLEHEDEDDYDEFVDDVCDDEYGDDSDGEEEDEFDQLPAPHAAAARGDLEHLQRLGKMDASLLASVDSAGRCPLFYAMAYDNVDVVRHILDTSPTCAQQTDMHGDTPLHAGCSSGSTESVTVLVSMLEGIGEDVNVVNSMGMSPMHLAQNAEVMSALYAANANLKVVDNSNRSPLFVAAAMNRTSCVEFLLDCLCGDDEAVYMIDGRGDTALHAAACNGASESLLLLLQCGITPLMTNNKGLKAIDLAQKNKQKKCREILAQYHLHFATTSDFDSVLFIATLEVINSSQ
jgi:ankyrin repeat protein